MLKVKTKDKLFNNRNEVDVDEITDAEGRILDLESLFNLTRIFNYNKDENALTLEEPLVNFGVYLPYIYLGINDNILIENIDNDDYISFTANNISLFGNDGGITIQGMPVYTEEDGNGVERLAVNGLVSNGNIQIPNANSIIGPNGQVIPFGTKLYQHRISINNDDIIFNVISTSSSEYQTSDIAGGLHVGVNGILFLSQELARDGWLFLPYEITYNSVTQKIFASLCDTNDISINASLLLSLSSVEDTVTPL